MPPFVQITGVWAETNISNKMSDVGTFIECLSNDCIFKTYIKVNIENEDKTYMYFGEVLNIEHIQQLESIIHLHTHTHKKI